MALLGWFSALPWLGAWGMFARLRQTEPTLNDQAPARGRGLSLIIPARNETATIDTILDSVLASDYAPLEVIVVDDRSTDDTATKVAARAATDARLRLVRGEELPAGWLGKNWACWQGAQVATGELLLFTDADTRHAPSLHARAAGFLDTTRADLVTVAPRQLSLTFWERVVMPQFWLLLAFRYHASVVNAATRARDAVANGQFLLFTRDAYTAIGGHRAVAGSVVEDQALGQAIVAAGRRLRLAYALDLMETRMYGSLGEIVRGWGKNVYLGSLGSYPNEPLLRALAPVLLATSFLFWLVPPLTLLTAPFSGVATDLLGGAAISVVASLGFWSLMCFGLGIPKRYALLYPLGALVALWIALRSTVRGRTVEWRGRSYSAAQP